MDIAQGCLMRGMATGGVLGVNTLLYHTLLKAGCFDRERYVLNAPWRLRQWTPAP
jgi:hypothetical protein